MAALYGKALGERITALRIKRGLSQSELAQRIDIDRASLCRLERGSAKRPSYDTILALAAAVAVLPAYLVSSAPVADPFEYLAALRSEVAHLEGQLASYRDSIRQLEIALGQQLPAHVLPFLRRAVG